MINRALVLQTWNGLKDKVTYNESYYNSEISSLNDKVSGLRNNCNSLEKTVWNLETEERTKKLRINTLLNYSLEHLETAKNDMATVKNALFNSNKQYSFKAGCAEDNVDFAINEINKAKKRNDSNDGPTIEEVD